MFKCLTNRALKYISIIIIASILLIVLGGLMIHNAHQINQAAILIRNHHIGFMIWRYSLMIVFIIFYPLLIKLILLRRGIVDEENSEISVKEPIMLSKIEKISRRRYAIIFCLFYELFIVQNILSLVINGLLHL